MGNVQCNMTGICELKAKDLMCGVTNDAQGTSNLEQYDTSSDRDVRRRCCTLAPGGESSGMRFEECIPENTR